MYNLEGVSVHLQNDNGVVAKELSDKSKPESVQRYNTHTCQIVSRNATEGIKQTEWATVVFKLTDEFQWYTSEALKLRICIRDSDGATAKSIRTKDSTVLKKPGRWTRSMKVYLPPPRHSAISSERDWVKEQTANVGCVAVFVTRCKSKSDLTPLKGKNGLPYSFEFQVHPKCQHIWGVTEEAAPKNPPNFLQNFAQETVAATNGVELPLSPSTPSALAGKSGQFARQTTNPIVNDSPALTMRGKPKTPTVIARTNTPTKNAVAPDSVKAPAKKQTKASHGKTAWEDMDYDDEEELPSCVTPPKIRPTRNPPATSVAQGTEAEDDLASTPGASPQLSSANSTPASLVTLQTTSSNNSTPVHTSNKRKREPSSIVIDLTEDDDDMVAIKREHIEARMSSMPDTPTSTVFGEEEDEYDEELADELREIQIKREQRARKRRKRTTTLVKRET